MAELTVRWLEGAKLVTAGPEGVATSRPDGFVWIDVLGPDEASLEPLAARFGLHPLAIEDCLHAPQRPKIERYAAGVFLAWVVPSSLGPDDVSVRELDVFLGEGHLITVHNDRLSAIDEAAARAAELMAQGADFMLHAVVDRLVDNALDFTDALADELESIEDVLLDSPRHEYMERIYAVRRRLFRLHRIIGPERDIIRALARERDLVGEEAFRYLQDVGDHLARVEDSIETAREVASASMDIYLSSVSNRTNEIMKTLTIVATLFMPLTLISGIYGMNTLEGMWPPAHAPWSFAAICAAMIAVSVGMMVLFRRRKWW